MQYNAHEKLETLYQQRTDRLKSLTLDDIIPHDSLIFWSPISASAPEIVTRLIEHHLALFEAEWREEIRDADFYLKAIHSRNKIGARSRYGTELANAHNRLTLAFINKFCKPDYSINWVKLVQSTSSKN